MSARSQCWSNGISRSRPIHSANLGQNQRHAGFMIRSMFSDSPRRMWFSFAPPIPEQQETVSANRSSVAPAQSAVLPLRESPTTAACLASRSGSVSIQSITRLAPHAHAERMPQSDGPRFEASCGPHILNTPPVATIGPKKSVADS